MRHPRPSVAILGIRGIPAAHGGFETFAERLALHLVSIGWRVVVYCQVDGLSAKVEDRWKGVDRVMIPARDSSAGSVRFDWDAITDLLRRDIQLTLTLGYNTAAFALRLRMAGVTNVINMDGIEWIRAKWGPLARLWFYCNEWLGCQIGNHLIADNPEIARHLSTRTRGSRITMIPYGADALVDEPVAPLAGLDLEPRRYLTLIARPEPENSILEIVRAFSARTRDCRLVVLGRYESKGSRFQSEVLDAASDEVMFPGGIYDQKVVRSLRAHCLLHIHGHRVGGTNPSLVEALGAGNAVLAHDNRFNRWVSKDAARYFRDESECADQLDQMIGDTRLLDSLRANAVRRHAARFTWHELLTLYEVLLREHLPVSRRIAERMGRALSMGEGFEHTKTVRS